MILVDSSVWIDYFRGRNSRPADKLDGLLESEPLAIGDLILAEVLQGFADDRSFEAAKALLLSLTVVDLGGPDIAIKAARHYRALRQLGYTVRKTIDAIIATRCIVSDFELLHDDRDFEPFAVHLGLRSVF